jgi:ABC-type bacteriocin/lantibiotic exporter with double-glycine peptidase domain
MKTEVKQHDLKDCGPACLASICSHYKRHIPIARLRQIVKTDKSGTSLLGMVKGAELLNFKSKGVKVEKDDLTKLPLPFIAHIVVENNLEHYVVVYHTSNAKVKIMDPRFGKIITQNIEEFIESWTSYAMLLMPSDEFIQKDERISLIKRLFNVVKPHKKIIFQIILGAVIYTVLGLSTSIYIQKISDYVFTGENLNMLNLLSSIMIFISVFQIIIHYLRSIISMKTAQLIDAQLVLSYYRHVLDLPISFFDNMRIGEIISRISDAFKIRVFVNEILVSIVINILVVVFSFMLMFFYNRELALLIIISLPLYSLIYFILNSVNKKTERKIMVKSALLESQLIESLNSIRTIKVFNLKERMNSLAEIKFTSLFDTIFQSQSNNLSSSIGLESISKALIILIFWKGGELVIDKQLSPGELMSFYALLTYLTGPLNSLISSNKIIQNALIAGDRLFEIMDLKTSKNTKQEYDINFKKVDISFKDVSFRYSGRELILNKINLNIKAGDVIGITGESGSGKSTISSLLLGMYDVENGELEISGVNIKEISSETLSKLISIAPQNIDFFSASYLENIVLDLDDEIDMKRIIYLCKKVGIYNLIMSQPDRFNTFISNNSNKLSGGEKQKLSLVRALYRDSPILILDEISSSLDKESEDKIKSLISEESAKGRTIIMIDHKREMLNMATRNFILKNKIIEELN